MSDTVEVVEEDSVDSDGADVLATLTEQRNNLLKQHHALMSVLDKHNIQFDITKADLSDIIISEDGSVSGDFDYSPPVVQRPKAVRRAVTSSNRDYITLDNVKSMTPEQINKNWDLISELLAANA